MSTQHATKTLLVFSAAGLLIIASIVVFTTQRGQVDIWRSRNDTTWQGEHLVTYRNVILDWVYLNTGVRRVLAPVRFTFSRPLSGEPDVAAIEQQLRSEGRFRDGDKVTCIQVSSPITVDGVTSYGAGVLVRNRDTRRTESRQVRISLQEVPAD